MAHRSYAVMANLRQSLQDLNLHQEFCMKIPLALICSAILASNFLRGAEPSSLEMVVSIVSEDSNEAVTRDNAAIGEGRYRYAFLVRLWNRSEKPLVVPKGFLELPITFQTIERDGLESRRIFCVWDLPVLGPSEVVIPSEAELGLVRLLKGEMTHIKVAFRTAQKINTQSISFVYEVTPALGARFGTWSGSVEERVLTQREMMLLQAKRQK